VAHIIEIRIPTGIAGFHRSAPSAAGESKTTPKINKINTGIIAGKNFSSKNIIDKKTAQILKELDRVPTLCIESFFIAQKNITAPMPHATIPMDAMKMNLLKAMSGNHL